MTGDLVDACIAFGVQADLDVAFTIPLFVQQDELCLGKRQDCVHLADELSCPLVGSAKDQAFAV